MPTVNVHQAKAQLSRLLALAEDGEEVVIVRRGEPVARLVACRPKGKRRFGAMKGQIVVDEGILDPLPEEELALWEGRASRVAITGWRFFQAARVGVQRPPETRGSCGSGSPV